MEKKIRKAIIPAAGLGTRLLKILPQTVAILLLGYLGCKVLDMLLGILKTWKNDNYKSGKMRDGIIRWIAEMVAIVFVIGIDLVLGLNFSAILPASL